MLLLILFAFLGGVVTVLSPCILPILPLVLSSSIVGGKKRPFGVVTGFVLSFTIFTLFLASIVGILGIPANSLRIFSVVVILLFGLSLLLPQIQNLLEQLFVKLSRFTPQNASKEGFLGGLIVGLSIGLVWTPCVGPILASVISLALTGSVTGTAFFITLSYAIGTAIPMLAIIYGGRGLLNKVPWLTQNTVKIQKFFGILMILTAVAIHFNFDRKLQTYILNKFPNYGVNLTNIEDKEIVKQKLEELGGGNAEDKKGAPMFDLLEGKGVKAPEIVPGGKWFNLEDGKTELTLKELKGKVVIVDFWTYTCINCIRTLPYLRSWYENYKDEGLVIIGVHTPEFEFEKDENNLKKAIEDFDLKYPIVQDNNYSTWRAYNNRFWPAKYFIDKDGFVRYSHFGEGSYDESEQVIRELLKEKGAEDLGEASSNVGYEIFSKTPETYLGYSRINNFSSLENIDKDQVATYTVSESLGKNEVAFDGDWFVMEEYSNPQKDSKLFLNFDSKEVFLVMRSKGEPSKVKVFVDNKLQYFGQDNNEGIVTVDTDRLYKLIDLPSPGQHILRLEFLDSNTEVFAFTFG